MGTPAAAQGDRIMGSCVGHQVPTPTGAPVAAPPLPFSAPVTQGTAATVLIGGRPAVVAGAAGINTPPHVGLHASDPFAAPPLQRGTVTVGSSTVLIEGRPAASTGARCQLCLTPVGTLQGTVSTVLIGGGPGG